MTDQELQLALAKMLPEKIHVDCEQGFHEETSEFFDTGQKEVHWNLCEQDSNKVRDTEWLHVCWLIEQRLTISRGESETDDYQQTLYGIVNPERDFVEDFCNGADVEFLQKLLSASWQQRARALIAVKGNDGDDT